MRSLAALAVTTVLVGLALGDFPEEVREQTPVFKTEAGVQSAQIHAYFKSIDLMVKLRCEANVSAFSSMEFGYVVGQVEMALLPTLALSLSDQSGDSVGSGDVDPTASPLPSLQDLSQEIKTMRSPFEKPKFTIVVKLTDTGIETVTTGIKGSEEWSHKQSYTWRDLAAQGD